MRVQTEQTTKKAAPVLHTFLPSVLLLFPNNLGNQRVSKAASTIKTRGRKLMQIHRLHSSIILMLARSAFWLFVQALVPNLPLIIFLIKLCKAVNLGVSPSTAAGNPHCVRNLACKP